MGIKRLNLMDQCPACGPGYVIGQIDIIGDEIKCSKSGLSPYHATHAVSLIHTNLPKAKAKYVVPLAVMPALKINKYVPPVKPTGIMTSTGVINLTTPVNYSRDYIGTFTPKSINEFPHVCPRCGGKCYIGSSTFHEDELRDSSCR